MSFLKKVASLPSHLPTGSYMGRSVLTGFAVDKGERLGGAAGIAFLKSYYADKFYVGARGYSVGYDVLGGALGYVVSGFLSAMSGGRSQLAPHVERLSDAALSVAAASWGAKKGMERAGRAVAVLAPGKHAAPTGLPGKKSTVMGAISPAMGGAYLSADEIANYAARR